MQAEQNEGCSSSAFYCKKEIIPICLFEEIPT